MAPRQKYTCLLCDTEKYSCRRATKELIGEPVKEAVELDTDHRSYSAVRERVQALIQANRQIKESDRFCMPCADHHMAGLRRKNVVPEKTVGGVCKCCKKDNAEHVLKAGMCPTCWETHQATCLRNEYAEDGVTCEKCHATECGGQHWYTGSEEGTYVCCKCYSEKALEEHRIQGTKCEECGNSECGGQHWLRGSEEGTYVCCKCYSEKALEEHRIQGTKCEECGNSECGGQAWYRGSKDGTYVCCKCYSEKAKEEHRTLGTKCEECGNSECGGQAWYRGSEEGTYVCRKCYSEKAKEEHRIQGTKCAKCGNSECGGQAWYTGSEEGTYVCCKCYSEIAKEEHRIQGTKCAKCGNSECGGPHWYRGSKDGTYLCKTCYSGARRAKKSGRIYTPRGTPLTQLTTPCEHCGEEETSCWHSGPRAGTRICHACCCKKCREEKKRSAPASKSAPRQPSKKRKATAAGAGTHAQGVVRKIIKKTNAAAFSLAGCSTRGGSAAA